MTTWFTSDHHFGHANILKHSKRPFADVDEMDAELIRLWNEQVGEHDDVWYLGDFCFRSKHPASWYLHQLKGRIHIVWGNHDRGHAKKYAHLFSSVQDVKYLRLNDQKITLYHYAQRVWQNSHHGAWHLFGHSHGCLPNYNRSMDVGVDAHNYRLVSFDDVKKYMDAQPAVTDHHPASVVIDGIEFRPDEVRYMNLARPGWQDIQIEFPPETIDKLLAEIEDWKHSFELYHKASMSLMHAYKITHPEVPENVWPDTTQVNVWAAQQIMAHEIDRFDSK